MWLFRSGIVLVAYLGITIYAGLRIFGFFRFFLPGLRAFIFWPLYFLCSFSYILVFLLRIDRIRPLRQAAMYSLPALAYFFMILLILDVVRLVLFFLKIIPKGSFSSAACTGIVLALTVLILIYGSFNARNIQTKHYEITLNKKAGEFKSGNMSEPGKLRITFVSDTHIGGAVDRKWLGKIVDAVNITKPDLICLAGDVFDNNVTSLSGPEGITAELRRFSAPLGVYACQGNHDVDRLSLRNDATSDRTRDFLENAGIRFLLDEVVFMEGNFYLVGRRDARPIGMSHARKSAAEMMSGLDKSRPIILLDHQPVDYLKEEEAGADLVLSGHTHRGQFFPGNIVTAYIYKKAGAVHYGYWKGRSAQAIVSSGVGVWGPPVRVATGSEVVVVDIKFGN